MSEFATARNASVRKSCDEPSITPGISSFEKFERWSGIAV